MPQRQRRPLLFFTLENQRLMIKKIQPLCDPFGQTAFIGLVFQNSSYCIIQQQTGEVMEYSLTAGSWPYQDQTDAIYGGPLSYQLNGPLMPKDVMDYEECLPEAAAENEQRYPVDRWVSLPKERFYPYRSWVTPSGYLCGTYAAAVLLAYYQDYLAPDIIPTQLRQPFAAAREPLLVALRPLIQPMGLPTVPLQVSIGLNRFFRKNKSSWRARFTSVGAWSRTTKRIMQGKPVIVGILRWLGSTYGNHWVTAYGFLETRDGQRFYRVHDNWGSYDKVINAKWANGTVSLP